MKNIKLFGVLLFGIMLAGCGGGGSSGGTVPEDAGAFFRIDGGLNVIVDGQESYTGEAGSALTVGNMQESMDSISEVYSNPISSDQGSNRITSPIPPGYEHDFSTSNCDQDYFLEVYFENGDYASLVYYRACGYKYYFLFKNY